MNPKGSCTSLAPLRDSPGAALLPRGGETRRPGNWLARQADVCLFAALLLVLNTPGDWTSGPLRWGFQLDAVRAGEVWRVFTHPFAHVSLYHLLLDGAAFLALLPMLGAARPLPRLGLAVGCLAGALVGAILGGPVELGYTGLSGAAHGLFALACLDLHRQGSPEAAWGLVILLGKCVLELLTGGAVLASLHAGDVGIPVVAGHAGGVLAGAVCQMIKRVHHTKASPGSWFAPCRSQRPRGAAGR